MVDRGDELQGPCYLETCFKILNLAHVQFLLMSAVLAVGAVITKHKEIDLRIVDFSPSK